MQSTIDLHSAMDVEGILATGPSIFGVDEFVTPPPTPLTPAQRKSIVTGVVNQLEQLFRTDKRKVLGFIRQRVHNDEEAEDIMQDVFANMITAAQNVQKPIDNVTSWVFTAVRNKIIDFYRKKKTESFSDMISESAEADGLDSLEKYLADLSYNPEVDLVRKTIWATVQEGLSEIPAEQRDVFVKNEFEGISFREMSEESGVNINTLLARKRYAVLHLREKLLELYQNLD